MRPSDTSRQRVTENATQRGPRWVRGPGADPDLSEVKHEADRAENRKAGD